LALARESQWCRAMQATTLAVALEGLAANLVRVEVDSGRGLPAFRMVGLPEAAVREARVRVRAALAPLGVDLNEYVITVNLAPAYLRKAGTAFDLAIAVATMAAVERIAPSAVAGTLLVGELSLSGELRAVRGVLPALLGARARGVTRAIVATDNSAEAAAVGGIDTRVAGDLRAVIAHLRGEAALPQAVAPPPTTASLPGCDLADVRGQGHARKALEIAAAGEHNLLMVGPPGAGKTMLARRLPTILPPMSDEESLTVTSIHSVAGFLRADEGLIRERPFRAPHHTLSSAAMLGGGAPLRPGEVSLAHHGCLFLDELPEFRRHVIEALRQPLEDGSVSICRAHARATYPARPLFVAAINPCPCGYAADASRRCTCTPERVRAYRARLSGPLLDRIDIHVGLPALAIDDIQAAGAGESSASVRARVVAAREIQAARQRDGETAGRCNGTLSQSELERIAPPDPESKALLASTLTRSGLSARAYIKVWRLARTIADLEGSDAVRRGHFVEALQLRSGDARGDAPMALAS
jgi:magnesium chelatase family protein